MPALAAAFVADYRERQYDYAFFHFRFPDSQGHSTGWDIDAEAAYSDKVREIDALLGTFFAAVETTPGLAGRTAIILTADHGGETGKKNHGNIFDPDNYTIPFYVWGPGVARGADLYALNPENRKDPSTRLPARDESIQPIRYGDVANLALAFLRLPPVPGSTINADQSLRVAPSGDQTVVTFQQGLSGYTGTADTYVRRHKRNSQYGGNATFVVDDADPWWSGRDNQTLLRFDGIIGDEIGQVPQGVSVSRATLHLRGINAGDGGTFHRMLRSWTETATWNSLGGGISANDQEATATPDARVRQVNRGALSVDVTTSVTEWVNGAPNHGWAILPDGGNGWDCYSSEGFMPPRLVVTFGYEPYVAKRLPPTPKTVRVPTTNKPTPINDLTLTGTYPNPFAESTTIAFTLREPRRVHLEVFDQMGRLVAKLIDDSLPAGEHQARFDAIGRAPGPYHFRLVSEGADRRSVLSGQLLLVR